MKKIFLTITLLLSFLILSFGNYLLSEDIDYSTSEEIILYLGEIKVFSVNTPSRIVIGNPEVADVVNVSEDTITLTAKKVGTTTFVFWDNFGEQSYRVKVFAEDMSGIKLRIDNLLKELNLPNVYTKTADTEGKVLLLGEVRTQQDKERIDLALGPLKEKTTDLITIKEEAIVDIDVLVLELNKDATKTLGFSMPGSVTATEAFTVNEEGAATELAVESSGRLKSFPEAIFRVFEWKRHYLDATIDFLVQEGKARILSKPKLTCQSGKEAELLVGGEKPIFATFYTSGGLEGVTIEYKEYGIKLKIKPIVTPDNKIHLSLYVEVSDVGAPETIGSETIATTYTIKTTTAKAYPLTKRNVSTELTLDDGQTLGIGGLIKQKTEEEIRKTPILGDIPIIGALFRKRTTQIGGGTGEKGDIDLVITLTPTIVKGREPTKEDSTAYKARAVLPVETKPLVTGDNVLPELRDYIRTVQLKIMNAVYYPQEAKDLGWEGTVSLALRLTSNGELKEARIVQSSGYKLLDDAALDVVKKQSPYPAFPYQIKSEELKIQIPIVYSKN